MSLVVFCHSGRFGGSIRRLQETLSTSTGREKSVDNGRFELVYYNRIPRKKRRGYVYKLTIGIVRFIFSLLLCSNQKTRLDIFPLRQQNLSVMTSTAHFSREQRHSTCGHISEVKDKNF